MTISEGLLAGMTGMKVRESDQLVAVRPSTGETSEETTGRRATIFSVTSAMVHLDLLRLTRAARMTGGTTSVGRGRPARRRATGARLIEARRTWSVA